jgi:phage terminase large subunit GpA-like protein
VKIAVGSGLSFDAANVIEDRIAVPQRLTPTQWATKYRVFAAEDAAQPGGYDVGRTPYFLEPQDQFANPDVLSVLVIKSNRSGGSESLYNCMGYAIDCDPGQSIVVHPTEDDAADEATGRIKRMIEASPRLRRHIPHDGFASAGKVTLRGNRSINMAWPRAPRTLIRKLARYLFFDELDQCEVQAGKLGEVLTLAADRITTWGHRGRVMATTCPTRPDAAGWTALQKTDRREFHCPCPECGTYQVLSLRQIKWPAGKTVDAIEGGGLAYYECCECKAKIRDGGLGTRSPAAWFMVARGVWVQRGLKIVERLPIDCPSIVDRARVVYAIEGGEPEAGEAARVQWRPATDKPPRETRRIGYHIGCGLSPWRSFTDTAVQFLRCKDEVEKLRVFTNQWLGEPFTDVAEKIEPTAISGRTENSYPRGHVPAGVKAIVMGVDVQLDYFVYELVGFGRGRRSYSIREGVCHSFEDLISIGSAGYPVIGSEGLTMPASWMAVDSAYRTAEVYEFAKSTPGVYAVKGRDRADWPIKPTRVQYTLKGTIDPRGVTLYHINVGHYKDSLHRLLRVPAGEPGSCNFHADTSADYFEQICGEHQVWVNKKIHGRNHRVKVWEPKTANQAVHYLDVRVYAMAIADFHNLLTIPENPPTPAVMPAPPRRPDRPPASSRPPGRGLRRS